MGREGQRERDMAIREGVEERGEAKRKREGRGIENDCTQVLSLRSGAAVNGCGIRRFKESGLVRFDTASFWGN